MSIHLLLFCFDDLKDLSRELFLLLANKMKGLFFPLLFILCHNTQSQIAVENNKEVTTTEGKNVTEINEGSTVNEEKAVESEEESIAIPGLDVATRLRMFNRQEFARILIKAQLFEVLYQNEKPYTLFTPNNDIVGNYTKNITNYVEIRRFAEYHVYRGSYEALDFQDGQRVTSYDNNKAFLNRLYNHMKKRMRIWVQGVEVQATIAKSGKTIIHLMNGYIEKPTETLFQYLERSGGYNIVMGIFKKYKLYFQFPHGVTFLAPLDKAFDDLPTKYREELFKDDVRIRMLIRNHIISRPMCRGRLFHTVGWTRVINNVGNTLQLYQDLFNKDASFVNSAAVVTSHAVTDGWTYGISDLLLPEINRRLLEELRFSNCHTFLQYLITTGHLQGFLSLLQIRTVFAPTDRAFEKLPNATKVRMTTDQNYLLKMISYHVTFDKHLQENLSKIKSLETAAKDSSGNNIRLHFGKEMSHVQRSRIIDGDRFALNGIVHIIDRVLIPPERSTSEIIESEKNLRIFKKYYKQINATFREMLDDQIQGSTLFIPSNRALKNYFQLLNTETEAEAIEQFNNVIWRHIALTPSWMKRSLLEVVEMPLKTMFRNNGKGDYDIIKITIPGKKTKGHIKIPEFNAQLLTTNQPTYSGALNIVDQVFADELKNISDVELNVFNKKTWKKLQKRWAKNRITPTSISKEASTPTTLKPAATEGATALKYVVKESESNAKKSTVKIVES